MQACLGFAARLVAAEIPEYRDIPAQMLQVSIQYSTVQFSSVQYSTVMGDYTKVSSNYENNFKILRKNVSYTLLPTVI